MEWSANINLDIFDFVEEENNVVEFPLRLTLPIEEPEEESKPKRNVTFANNDELTRLSKAVMKENEKVFDTQRGYFQLAREAQIEFFGTFKDKDGNEATSGTICKAWSVLLYLLSYVQNTENYTDDSKAKELGFKSQYNGSCYKSMSDIQTELNIRRDTLRHIMDLLVLNGYMIRKVSMEKSDKPKYYFFVLQFANKELLSQFTDDRITQNKDTAQK